MAEREEPAGQERIDDGEAGSPQGGVTASPSPPGVDWPGRTAPMPEAHGPVSPAAQSVGFTLSSLGYAVSRRFSQTLAPLQLEPREFALLRAVRAAEGQTQQAIAAGLRIPASRMVAFVDALERRGLLERRHNPRDRRARELHLTASGDELLQQAFARAAALEAQLCAGLRPQERTVLLDTLHRIGAAMGLPAGVHAAHEDDGETS